MHLYIYSGVKKSLLPSWFLNFLHICRTWIIQIIKQILMLHKDNPSKYKMQFWNNDFIIIYRFGQLFSLNKWNHHLKTEFCIYLHYLCVILKSVWWSESYKCDKYAKKKKKQEGGKNLFTALYIHTHTHTHIYIVTKVFYFKLMLFFWTLFITESWKKITWKISKFLHNSIINFNIDFKIKCLLSSKSTYSKNFWRIMWHCRLELWLLKL